MARTVFGPGVRITSKWLNGSQSISFDGADEDWHYPPLTNDAVQLSGDGGFDKVFVTLETTQLVTGPKTWSADNLFTGALESSGQTTAWLSTASDKETYLSNNEDGVVTNKVLQDYFSTVDGGDIG